MPKRPDGRIEPGQRLSTAISARAWNRAQDAADIVLGERSGFEAGPRVSRGLPQARITLPTKGFFGQAFRPVLAPVSAASLLSVSSGPPSGAVWNYSTEEQKLPAFGEVISDGFGTGTLWTDSITNAFDHFDGPVAICVDNDSRQYAVSGIAIARVRVFNYLHRCARFAATLPTGESTESQNVAARGCLDSTFHGPIKILGYALVASGTLQWRLTGSTSLTWPNLELRWALVQF